MHIGRAAVFNAEAAARQPQGAFIDQGRGTGRAEDRTGLRNCQIATFVDGQGSTVGRAYRYVIQRQRRVAGSGGDDELVGGRAWGDDILPLKRPRSGSLFITPFVVGVEEHEGHRIARRQGQ